MLLKRNKRKIVFSLLFFFILSDTVFAKNQKKEDIKNYIEQLKNFSASFIQENDNTIDEGKLYIGKERVRIDYFAPTNILIVLDSKKAMYYNYNLEEVEFFNPKKTSAWYFFELFKNKNFLDQSSIVAKNKNLIITKKVKNSDTVYNLKIYFEEDPMILRKIELFSEDFDYVISLFNHSYYEKFDRKFFKLISPKIINN